MTFEILSGAGILVLAAYIFGGIADAVCGGGGLITVPALMSIGLPAHMVVGTNHCSMLPGCWTSCIEYGKAGKVDFKLGLCAVPFALVGALIGARLNLILDDRYLRIIMIVLIPILAIFSILKRDINDEDNSDSVPIKKQRIGVCCIAFIVSIYHAFYGPASGIFYMISFATLLKCGAVKANGMSRFILACVNIMTTIIYSMSGNVIWKMVIVAMVGYTIGNYAGARIAISKGAKVIKPLYYCVLAGLMVKLVLSLLS